MQKSLQAPIIITHPEFFPAEAQTLCALLRAGAGVIHLRKPGAAPAHIEALCAQLRAAGADLSRFTLHGPAALARACGVGGVHLKARELHEHLRGEESARPEAPSLRSLRLSCSTHTWEEAEELAPQCHYLFLSPVFDSISKPGYGGAIDLTEAAQRFKIQPQLARKVVALGGVEARNVAQLRRAGFGGVALLGALWSGADQQKSTPAIVPQFELINRRWQAAGGVLQLISDGSMQVARAFLQGGGRWIQLRMKGASAFQIARRGAELLELCRRFGAVMQVNDDPTLLPLIHQQTSAHGDQMPLTGVHLGRNDASPAAAREVLGEGVILGSTANSVEDILALAQQPTDYIGLGPFRYTTTKQNLAPILGAEAYRRIIAKIRSRGIDLPVVAIGGITLGDVEALMATGVDGIALSGAIAQARDVEGTTRAFLHAICAHRILVQTALPAR